MRCFHNSIESPVPGTLEFKDVRSLQVKISNRYLLCLGALGNGGWQRTVGSVAGHRDRGVLGGLIGPPHDSGGEPENGEKRLEGLHVGDKNNITSDL